ncbi:EamA family transporter [Acinetobacter seifertii]|uniref:DMT family transporter n=1 Tax=Acinetobacter TaxID=469 RepID=UPI00097FA15B|nr:MULTISPECIES: EamA family transporter [Acinetobacter]ONN48281.1 membrane protein [Acinetobacter genomosp. 33YU]PJG68069.1 EamA family transporter [Acinetobacter seifertii]QNW94584.1 EamA family transporter [Acinetobacter seifertii]QNX01644.1 EamA family transporter [Acinetobacter seifertii]
MISLIKNSNYGGTIAILVASILWGTTGTAAAFAPTLGPLAIGAAAMGGGGLLQALVASRAIRENRQFIRENLLILLLGIVAVGIYPLAFYSSMHYAGITIGTVVSIGSAPLIAAILERFFDRKALSTIWFLSFVCGVLGVTMLSMGESHAVLDSTNQWNKYFGIFLGLVAATTYSLYSWTAKKLIDRGVASKAAMGMIMGGGAVILLPTLLVTGEGLLQSSTNLLVAGYMMLIPMFLGYLLFGFGLKTVNASKATTLTLFEPLVAAIFAIVLVGEHVSWLGWIGMFLIFICILILSKTRNT